MKNLFRFLFILFIVSTNVNAQWVTHYTLTDISWAGRAKFVNENIFWGIVDISNGVGGFFKTTDAGNSFYLDTLDNCISVTAFHPVNANKAFYGILDLSGTGRMIKTIDGGLTWVTVNNVFGNTGSWIDYIYFFSENNGFAFGDPIQGRFEIYTTSNGGESWERVLNVNIPICLSNEYANNVAFAANGDILWIPTFDGSGGNRNRIFKSTDRGNTWTVGNSFSGSSGDLLTNSIAFKNNIDGILILSSMFASNFTTSDYQILKTTDGGNSWTEIAFPFPIDPAIICDIKGTTSGYFVSAPIINTGTAYTLDGGVTWVQVGDKAIFTLDFLSPSIGWAFDWNTPTIYRWNGPALPVELISFTAQAQDQKVILKWSTATELNNNGFEIQRKVAEGDFATIGFVKGEGTTTNQKEYSYVDKDLVDGKYYYRLKQIDYNGTYEYSDVIEVDVRSLNDYALEQNFPNPFNPSTQIKYSVPQSSQVQIIVFDVLGNELETLVNEEKPVGTYELNWNAVNLPSGIYFYQLQAGDFVQTKKMLLLK